MVPKKYKQSNELLSQTKGLPNSIQQKIIISDERIKITKNCVLTIKDSIKKVKEQSNGSKTSVWIPYYKLLQQELPANKGTDVRFAKRVFALLDIVPIVKHNLRSVLLLEDEKSIIANLDDLLEVLSITHNFDGLPKFKAEFFNDIFLELYKTKISPDSSDDGKKTEDIIAVTTRQLGDYNKTKTGKSITSDHMKKTYLNSFINEGLIDHLPSKLDRRQEIYYPLVTEKISLISIMDRVNNLSQQKPEFY